MSASKSATPTVPAKILLVDDNAHGLKARKTVLEELGYKISTASCGDDALESFGKQKFDLVVTDYKMPRMNGIELIVQLRKKSPALPIILISGYVDALGLSEQNTNADAVIQKSANEVSHLVRAVARLLRPKAARKPAQGEGGVAKRKTAP
ncbi:MAG TPA: response regulator [Bryobacteraceae bacterium]|jgi:CheY-like chemotaxis protein